MSQGVLNKLKQEATKEANKIVSPSSSTSTAQSKNKLSANVTRTVVVNLKEGEVFDYSENCIDLGASINQVSFIVTKGNGNTAQCFSYKNGVRTPVACPTSNSSCGSELQCSYNKLMNLSLDGDEIKKYVSNKTEDHKMPQATLTDEQLKAMSAYMSKEQLEAVKKQMAEAQKQTAGQTYSTVLSSSINFNGKTYGPYKQISQFYLTSDKKTFYAVVQEGTQGFKVVTSASALALTLPGLMPPLSCLASPDNSEFAVTSLNTEGKYDIITSSGKKYPVTEMGWFGGAWYSAAGNHMLMLMKSQLYFDGHVIKTFEDGSSQEPCNLYVSNDGKGVTIVKNNTLSFSDGDYFEYPLKIAVVNSAGKSYFKWMALENQEVVIYQKPY
ncbi:hypothetical protein WSM22_16340 [Cytophagales bacterium WSM2-2]|nr:hypothetical protein WSM22_16340 [Cytophagales bacterium WSM2-2]